MLIIAALGIQRWEDPWGLLLSQASQVSELQVQQETILGSKAESD